MKKKLFYSRGKSTFSTVRIPVKTLLGHCDFETDLIKKVILIK